MDVVTKRRLDRIHSTVDMELQKARYKYQEMKRKQGGSRVLTKEQFREACLEYRQGGGTGSVRTTKSR